jgi:LPXTG-motif cell wall-anchored protein
MPIALHALMVATLAIPAAVPAAMTPQDCTVGGFTARTQADLVKVKVLESGPNALADLRLASAKGTVDSSARPYKSIASGLHAGGAGARHAAPGRGGPDEKQLVAFNAAGLATAGAGKSTAHATWDNSYRCGATGPLTRAATMLGGLSVLDSGMTAGNHRTSLLRIGPTGSAQSATDLIPLGNGRIGVRSGAGVALGDISLLAGTPQEVSIKIVTQPTLEVVAGGERHRVDYRPAVLRVTAAGKPVQVLKDSGATVSLGLLGGVGQGAPAALEARISLGEVRESRAGRQVQAEAATLRVEVKAGMTHLLDLALGQLSVAACAPALASASASAGNPRPQREPRPASSPSASPSASEPAADPVPVSEPSLPSSGTGGGDLALTGSDVSIFGFAGAGLILAGLISLLLTRRRRPN